MGFMLIPVFGFVSISDEGSLLEITLSGCCCYCCYSLIYFLQIAEDFTNYEMVWYYNGLIHDYNGSESEPKNQ